MLDRGGIAAFETFQCDLPFSFAKFSELVGFLTISNRDRAAELYGYVVHTFRSWHKLKLLFQNVE